MEENEILVINKLKMSLRHMSSLMHRAFHGDIYQTAERIFLTVMMFKLPRVEYTSNIVICFR